MRPTIFCMILTCLAGCATDPGTHGGCGLMSTPLGDLTFIHPVARPKSDLEKLAYYVPQESKDHTYLFFINGLDPFSYANFCGQCQYMRFLGYRHSYCGQMQHVGTFRDMILQIHHRDPAARFVLIGYSLGANLACSLAHQLNDQGVNIELLAYVSGDMLPNSEESRPPNVNRIVNVMGHTSIAIGYDLFVRGEEIPGAVNYRVDALHFHVPSRVETTESLLSNIVELDIPTPQVNHAPALSPSVSMERQGRQTGKIIATDSASKALPGTQLPRGSASPNGAMFFMVR